MGGWRDSVYDNGILCEGGKEANDGLLYFLVVGDFVPEGLNRREECVSPPFFESGTSRGEVCYDDNIHIGTTLKLRTLWRIFAPATLIVLQVVLSFNLAPDTPFTDEGGTRVMVVFALVSECVIRWPR